MRFVYYIDGEKFTTDDIDNVPFYEIFSPNEETPAYQELESGEKLWCEKGYIWHRLIGPAVIYADETVQF
jgi:hypothetical protein